MLVSFLRPKNLSQKMMRVIFSIYLLVLLLITGLQFLAEYVKTQESIVNELEQLEETVRGSFTASLWQYNEKQLDVLVSGILKLPIVAGVDVFDNNAVNIASERSYLTDSVPLFMFESKLNLSKTLNGNEIALGSVVLYSSSEVVFDRVLYGFSLIAVAAIVKLSLLFWLFIWAFYRYMAIPLNELMSQVNEIKDSQNVSKRIKLPSTEVNELSQLQDHMNNMLMVIERDQKRLLEDEHAKRQWLEEAVAKRTKELEVSNLKLKELAAIDSLTGALNRGSFFETAQHFLDLAQRQKSPATFILMDLDHFKMVNDTYGHFTGDQVLIHFIQTIQTYLRKSDLIGRVGGEEFALFLSDAGTQDAVLLADKIRKAVGDSTVMVEGEKVNYTVSLGIATSGPSDQSIDELFKRADLKLYEAKDKGRDRVET